MIHIRLFTLLWAVVASVLMSLMRTSHPLGQTVYPRSCSSGHSRDSNQLFVTHQIISAGNTPDSVERCGLRFGYCQCRTSCLHQCMGILLTTGQYKEAFEMAQQAVAIHEHFLGAHSAWTLESKRTYADVLKVVAREQKTATSHTDKLSNGTIEHSR
jgi:hypothetical protein